MALVLAGRDGWDGKSHAESTQGTSPPPETPLDTPQNTIQHISHIPHPAQPASTEHAPLKYVQHTQHPSRLPPPTPQLSGPPPSSWLGGRPGTRANGSGTLERPIDARAGPAGTPTGTHIRLQASSHVQALDQNVASAVDRPGGAVRYSEGLSHTPPDQTISKLAKTNPARKTPQSIPRAKTHAAEDLRLHFCLGNNPWTHLRIIRTNMRLSSKCNTGRGCCHTALGRRRQPAGSETTAARWLRSTCRLTHPRPPPPSPQSISSQAKQADRPTTGSRIRRTPRKALPDMAPRVRGAVHTTTASWHLTKSLSNGVPAGPSPEESLPAGLNTLGRELHLFGNQQLFKLNQLSCTIF
ncbi:hypothetical protein PTTG_00836 [Puccinia triticina 1-1 BBBD Race 1]|uniref:Uncharacterized protein n=1 Tax=Puccinia triticina (isolate 1-1 / race 1 (BBBD)) TaxID=630390 RepID=A0A0C4EJB8_PUCT1|nr:hypothetical protein PTTG_00836 [Puccinia triticina 1-1 BBBD Race 1]